MPTTASDTLCKHFEYMNEDCDARSHPDFHHMREYLALFLSFLKDIARTIIAKSYGTSIAPMLRQGNYP